MLGISELLITKSLAGLDAIVLVLGTYSIANLIQ